MLSGLESITVRVRCRVYRVVAATKWSSNYVCTPIGWLSYRVKTASAGGPFADLGEPGCGPPAGTERGP